MAIKKGAFDLYTQERQLPAKKSVSAYKKGHFFDDIDKEPRLLETVHERFTSKGSEFEKKPAQDKQPAKLEKFENGSQMVHDLDDTNQFLSKQNTDLSVINSSQTVHNPSSIKQASDINDVDTLADNFKTSGAINGSQIVHERFTEDFKGALQNTNTLQNDKVAEINFSKIIGIQRAVVIALYKNMKFNRSDTTNELTLEAIASLSGVNQKSLKNTLFRLSRAGVIMRSDQKNGRSGWVKYQINTQILEEIRQNEFLWLSKK